MEERVIDKLHNNPPDVIDMVKQEQSEKYAEKLREFERLMAKRHTLPAQVNSDEESGQISDWVKLVKSLSKEIDNLRLIEKKKYTVWSDAIQNFWKGFTDKIKDTVDGVSEPNEAYLQKKRDEEVRQREEKARLAKEEADRKLKEAQEKERIAQEAAERERKERERVEREAEAARLAREAEIRAKEEEGRKEAERIRKEAEDRHKAEMAAQQKIIDDLKKADQERKAKADKEERDRAEEKRLREENQRAIKEAAARIQASEKLKKQEMKQADTIEKEVASEIRDIEREGRADEHQLMETVNDAAQEAKAAQRDVGRAMDEAVRADKFHAKAEKQTLAGVADLSRTRGFGSVASLREDWEIECANRDELDMEALRDHFTADAIQAALRSWLRANEPKERNAAAPTFKGALITQKSTSVVR